MKPAPMVAITPAQRPRHRSVPLRVQAGKVALHALGWSAWIGLLFAVDVQSASAKPDASVVAAYLALGVIGFAVPWYASPAVFRRLKAGLATRLAAVAILALAWSACMLPISVAFGLPASFLQGATGILFVAFVSVGISETLRGLRARRRVTLLEQLRIAAEQQLLGAQLAPHTLFNLLNTLYAVSLSRPGELVSLVRDLSRMMAPLTTDRPAELHTAEDEWRFIEAYRRFALVRLDPHSHIELDFKGDPSSPLPAFLTATLFENAVKHGMDSVGKVNIAVEMQVRADGFVLRMSNRLSDAAQAPPGMRAGVDLVRQRLQYLYPYRHRFEAARQGPSFEVLMEAW